MSSITNTQDDQPLQESHTNGTADSKVEVRIKTVTIDVFFDGTGNNMFNTDIRLKENPNEKEIALQKKLKTEISYNNDYSNVVHLYKASTINESKGSVYIQGSGTLKEETDFTFGLAAAWGETGIDARIKEAFDQINKAVKKKNGNQIILNVYGFSRGSFFARYFCALAKLNPVKTEKDLSLAEAVMVESVKEQIRTGRNLLQYQSHEISINFVGIYDTVTSEGLSPNNDAIPFKQDIGKKQGIRKIFHLTAQNEFRNHFPLTEINTAITEKNDEGYYIGYECSIPGAHSDIGGGYTKPWPHEKDIYLSVLHEPKKESDLGDASEIHWSWFQNKGYYSSGGVELQNAEGTYGEFTIKKKSRILKPDEYQVYATRYMPGNEYQFIGLSLMHQVATEVGGVTFDESEGRVELTKRIQSIQDEKLKIFHDFAMAKVRKNAQIGGKYDIKFEDCTELTQEMRRAIYHDYIHNSLVAKMIWRWENKMDYIANGSDRNNKDDKFTPRRIITKDNKGYFYNRSATDRV